MSKKEKTKHLSSRKQRRVSNGGGGLWGQGSGIITKYNGHGTCQVCKVTKSFNKMLTDITNKSYNVCYKCFSNIENKEVA